MTKLTPATKKLLPLLTEGLALPPIALTAAAQLLATAPAAQPRLRTMADGDRTWLLIHSANMPFLTDTALLTAQHHGHAIANLWHPVVQVTRTEGTITRIRLAKGTKQLAESLILFSLHGPVTQALAEDLKHALLLAQGAVHAFPTMQQQLADAITTLAATRSAPKAELAFLQWLSHHFIMLGSQLGQVSSGILQHTPIALPAASKNLALTLLHHRAPVHRSALLTCLSVPLPQGQTLHLIGLFSASAYAENVANIPLVRDKVHAVQSSILADQNWEPHSHSGRNLRAALALWPRDELFFATQADLTTQALTAVRAREGMAIGVLARTAGSCTIVQVLIPLAQYESHHRTALTTLLEKELQGEVVDYHLTVGDGSWSHLTIHLQNCKKSPPLAHLTSMVTQLVSGWQQQVTALAPQLASTYIPRAPSTYVSTTTPAQAAADFGTFDTLIATGTTTGTVTATTTGDGAVLHLFSTTGGWPLHHIIPIIQSTGLAALHEDAFNFGGGLHLQRVVTTSRIPLADDRIPNLQAVVLKGLHGEPHDELNRLVLTAALTAAEVTWLRAWVAYAQQLQPTLAPEHTRAFLLSTPAFARALIQLFHARHNPAKAKKSTRQTDAELNVLIINLPTAAQENIALTLASIVRAMLRTNAFSGNQFGALAFKVDSAQLHHVPTPVPFREIFVWHPQVEGVHLRGGPVARGGLRHSDRGTDYRIEVLGLMAAQMRKNTIIVPVGAKGGFFIKAPMPSERTEAAAFFTLQYQRFVDALLSVTDTYDAHGHVVHPRSLLRHDGPDPYLVVAADKGTAKMSDTANALSQSANYWAGLTGGFWLADAFASGGSNGYDHKGMGITAKGAWISVQQHLANLGITPSAKQPITIVGVGDMGGDVFGNGLLREPHAHLLAAFNHQHIFLDPAPNLPAAFAERQRLFHAGLGWGSYTPALISSGGGVFLRTDKTIPLSSSLQQQLGLRQNTATPDEVIRAILCALVDVLWHGGIGTYIKASTESHAEVADKANDAVRVDAKHVRARTIGEGGNLGITPRGRIELALRGTQLNTDALDNSAGVSTSDHEVNLKILLGQAQRQGTLTEAARLALLPTLTADIEQLVLADNHAQNQVISLTTTLPSSAHAQLMAWQQQLQKWGYLDPQVDVLPTPKELTARPQGTYTRPEIAALMAGTKAWLKAELLTQTDHLNTLTGIEELLANYFPQAIQQQFATLIPQHPLRPALLATLLANHTINHWGIGSIITMGTTTPAHHLISALWAAQQLTQAPQLWAALAAPTVPQPTRIQALVRLQQVGLSLAQWLLRHPQVPVAQLIQHTTSIFTQLPSLLTPTAQAHVQQWQAQWQAQGLPASTAQHFALLSPLAVVPAALQLAQQLGQPAPSVVQAHLAVGEALHLPALMRALRSMPMPDDWHRQATSTMATELHWRQLRLTRSLLAGGHTHVATWFATRPALQACTQLIARILKEKHLTIAMLTTLLGHLRELEEPHPSLPSSPTDLSNKSREA